ncbi:hypothetical protein [Secundilactobacillus kimchicus]|nr:hypothetical protein [Secundilactobacillus kimchicus]
MTKRNALLLGSIMVSILLTLITVAFMLEMSGTIVSAKNWTNDQPTSISQKSTKAIIKSNLLAKYRKIAANYPGHPVSIAVYSKEYGMTVKYNNNRHTAYKAASIIKTAFLAKVLHDHQAKRTKLTKTQRAEAAGAMIHSNNEDATALYAVAGGRTGMNKAFSHLRMAHTADRGYGWAFTRTTAFDQLKLLDQIFYSTCYLNRASKSYMQGLMNHVAKDQNWGVSAGSNHFQLKNGWRLRGGRWMVNSIGHIGKGKRSCTIAVLTDRHTDLKRGIKYVEQFASATGNTLKLKNLR